VEAEGSSETFAELFETTKDKIKQLQDGLIAVQTSRAAAADKEAAYEYINLVLRAIRANSWRYRKSMMIGAANQTLSSALDDMRQQTLTFSSYSYNPYLVQAAIDRGARAAKEAKEASDEQLGANRAYINVIRDLKTQMPKLSKTLPDYDLIDAKMLDGILKGSVAIDLITQTETANVKSKSAPASAASPAVERAAQKVESSDEGEEEAYFGDNEPEANSAAMDPNYNAAALRLQATE
jgi:hypothetical protein